MRLTDPIADMLSRIRNAHMAKHFEVRVPHSKMKEGIASIFREEGYIEDFRVIDTGSYKTIIIRLKYTEEGTPAIKGLKRISRPGCRVYSNRQSLKPVLGGLGHGIVSTSQGLKTLKKCMKENIGGEYVCQIW